MTFSSLVSLLTATSHVTGLEETRTSVTCLPGRFSCTCALPPWIFPSLLVYPSLIPTTCSSRSLSLSLACGGGSTFGLSSAATAAHTRATPNRETRQETRMATPVGRGTQ